MSDIDTVRYCFVPDEKEVFAIAEITHRNAEKAEATVSLLKGNKTLTVKYENVVAIGSMEELNSPPSDLIKLVYVNRPGILHTLRTRFMQDSIYTSIGPILVALNPFKWITGIYEEEVMLKYKNGDANLSDQPHVFAVSQDAYSDLYKGSNQSLIISGESGAGKTEATKQCLNYLAFLAGSATGIQSKILKASPILEAWGNAKTLRNNNSSRFGKFIEIWFDSNYTITGSSNTTYILEKSRVVFQEKDERNYHVFYQLLRGATPELLQQLELTDLSAQPEEARFINQSGCIQIENVDDAADFKEVNEAFSEIGFTPDEQTSLYTIIAGILHLGNVTFIENPSNSEESTIPAEHWQWLHRGARQLGVDAAMVERALLHKQIRSGGNAKRMSIAYAAYKPHAAYENRNALVKEIYRRCFDYIVGRINALMENDKDQAVNMIGILDIFGFEIFQRNSFEQLCINLANEALQQHFNYNIFQAEMDIYNAEDVPVPPLEYKDNQDVLDLIMKRPQGLIPMLDEEGLVPRGSWEGFLSKYTKQHAKNPRFKKAKLTTDLGVVHYAGEVFYDASLFLVKNKDTLSADLVDVFSLSTLPLLQRLFTEVSEGDRSPTETSSGKRASTQSAAKMTVGRSFSLQLEKLIADLNSTQPRYIRCIKPNQVKKPNIFVPDLTNEQLTYSGVFEAVIIMQNGYPFRRSHEDFRKQYHMLVRDASQHASLFDSSVHGVQAVSHSTSGPPPPPPPPPPPSVEGQSDVALTTKKVRKPSLPCSRAQCQLLVQYISEAYSGRSLERCFVGKTRTFYQAPQHNALESLRNAIVPVAALRIQTFARSFIARKLTRAISLAEQAWRASLRNREVDNITRNSQAVDALVARLNLTVPNLAFSLDCTSIGKSYHHAFESEGRLGPAIRAAIEEPVDMMDKYDRLEVMLKSLDTVNFNTKYRTDTLSFRWEDNAELKEQADKIVAMGELVNVKRKFQRGIANKNEEALEEAVAELAKLKGQGKIVDDFCAEEATKAKRIIAQAEEIFATLISTVTVAIYSGALTAERTGGSFDLQVRVDPTALVDIVNTFDEEHRNRGNSPEPPMRIRALQLLCTQLRDLRLLAKQGKWEDVWAELQTHWDLTTEINDATATSAFRMSQSFLPTELKTHVLDELKAVSLAAINFFVMPQVQAAVSRNMVPNIPSLGAEAVAKAMVDTAELTAQIAAADAYAEYFDEGLHKYLQLAKEHLYFRTEMNSGDWVRIKELSTRTSVLPADHPDRLHVHSHVKMHEMVTLMKARIVEDRVFGEPGSVDFGSIRVDGLGDLCEQALTMSVLGTTWTDLLEAARAIRLVRVMLQKGQFTEAWTFMQELQKSPGWMEVTARVASNTADDSVAEALRSVVEELQSYDKEILHARSMRDIALALNQGGIGDETEDFSTLSVDVNSLQTELDGKIAHLILTPAAKRLIDDTKTVIKARTLALASNWSELEKLIVPLHSSTSAFAECRPGSSTELKRYYDKVFDLKVHRRLLDSMQKGQLRVIPSSVDVRCDIGSLTATSLQESLAYAQQGFVLSRATVEVLTVANALYCLRSVVLQDIWEPAKFFFGSTPTTELVALFGRLDTDASLYKAKAALESTIGRLDRLESEINFEKVADSIAATEVSALSLSEIVAHLRRNAPSDINIQEEIQAAERLNNDRRCKLMLLMSASTGMIQGNLDEFDCTAVVTNHLEVALAYVESRQHLQPSSTVRSWSEAAKYLVSVRQTIIRAATEHPGVEPVLSEVFYAQDLQDILKSMDNGYPTKELRLVLNKLIDQASIQELLQALLFGQAIFENGKVDVARVQYSHLEERLEAAKKNSARSDRLDRLFFYIELTISMRKAISWGQWELNDREKSVAEGANARLTVKRCMKEFEQARRFFSSPVEGVPPSSLIDEFRLIGREWERRLVKQRFATAFKAGAVTGHPLSLNLQKVRTELLETEIARMKEAQTAATEKDSDFDLFMQAGEELVSMRKEAIKIHASYKLPVKFSFPSNSLHNILDAQDFISDAISAALNNVERITRQPYKFAEEWSPIGAVVSTLKACPQIPATLGEVSLLRSETQDRAYIVSVLNAINAACGARSPKSSRNSQQDIVMSLTAAQLVYDQRQAENKVQQVKTKSDRGSVLFRHTKIREIVHNSAVTLLHFVRTNAAMVFDTYARDWSEDKNFSKTPRIYTLAQNLSTSYSMQQILRSAAKVELHTKVRGLLDAATMRLEDAVSRQEMLLAFSEDKYVFTGTAGHVKAAPQAVPYMNYVLERIDKIGVQDHQVVRLRNYFRVHLQLRQMVELKNYPVAFEVLDDFVGNGKRSLEFVLEVLNNRNYQVIPEALQEFLLLAQDICDHTWQFQAEAAVVAGRIRGKRGAVHVTEIDTKAIEEVLRVLQLMPVVSDHSEYRKQLCSLVKDLRYKLLGNGVYSADLANATNEQSVAFQKLQFAQSRSDFGVLAPKVLHKFIDQVIATVSAKVDSISAINITWANLEEINSFSQYVQPVIDALNVRINGELVMSGMFREELLQECELVHKHCESLQAGLALEASLQSNITMRYSAEGLEIQPDAEGLLVRTLSGAIAQRWQFVGHPEEYWWACLTALGKTFLGLYDHIGLGPHEKLMLRPGTAAFKSALPEVYALIAQVNNITKQLKLTGHRKRAALPSSILTACDTMRLAIAEHNTLFRLEKIIGADCIENLSSEDTHKVIIKVVNLRPILHISKDEEIVVNVNFEQYGRDIKAMVASAKVDTTLGKLLVDMLHQLLDLRMAVANKRWFLAKQICAGFQWIGEFASCPDVEVCQRFLRYKECHRAIENAILCCSLPSIVGWSLHPTSREIALKINDRVLSEFLLSMKDKYGSLVIQYVTLSQLIAVGEKMLSLLAVLRKSLWVGAHQYAEELDHTGEGFKYFTADDIDAPLSLRTLMESSSSLEPHMQRFLLQTATNLENEMLVVQLEHCAQRTLRAAIIAGKPGELTYASDAVSLLQTLSEKISTANALARRYHGLLAAEQVAKVLVKVIEAHQSGDLINLVRHVDLLAYLSEIDCRPGTLAVSAVPVSVAVADDELLKMDDSVFGHAISVKATPTTLPTVGQGSGYIVTSADGDELSTTGGAMYWDTNNATAKGELQKAFVLATNSAFSDAIVLRAEFKAFLNLLHQHVVVESMYKEYVQVVKVLETQTEPGALNIKKIRVDELDAFMDKYRSYFPAVDNNITANLGYIMLDMVISLHSVRQGQIHSDIQLISIGLEQAGAACVKENNYELLIDCVPFGEETKHCFDQILEEIELADQDLKQRRLIENLRTALASPGVPTTHYPFDIGGIRIEVLDAAYEDCKETPPACPEARRLHQAASVLLVLRKYALRRDWVAMIEFVESIEEGEMDSVFIEDELYSEFEATKEVMLVSHAIDLALESYLAGYIGGTVGAIAPCGDTFLDSKGPQAAMEVFARLDVEWIVPRVLQHANTCETLQVVRANTATRNWEAVYPASSSAMDGLKAGWRDLVPFCIPEIELARDHSAYMISCKELQRALDTGSLRGTVGDVHVWQVEIDTLQEAYKTVTTINCRREDVLRLKKSVEFLFRIRKAILLDQWIHQDITHDYLNLLGSNFQLQSERVQQNNLNAVLVDESLRNPARVDDTITTLSDNIVSVGSELTFSDEHAAYTTTSSKPDLAQLAHTEYAPEPVFETVETILQHWAEIKVSRALAEEAEAEVELAHQEMRHRQMVSMLLKNIHTPGIQGLPGQIDTAHATTRLLEKAILIANENSDVSQRGDCKGLLRDAKLLLMARRYRINEQWVELHHMLEEIELTLSNEMAAAEEAEATASSNSEHYSVPKDYIRPIVKPVWQELQLLKFDCLFQLHLTTFTFEMTKPAPPSPPGDNTEPSKHVTIKQTQVDALRAILEASEAAALEFPSIEFNRLIEAQACALELRTFALQYPNKSPQEIIHHVALTKKRDEEAGLTSYMALLIHDISKMANVLDFPVNLKTIHREIVKGQKYFSCPIGTLETWLIDIELMSVAYNAAIPSLELFGTASDHSFMRMADAVIKLRGALLRGGLPAAIQVVDDNEVALQDPLMKDEVERLRIEIENYDAGKLMEVGLKTGRYIDVLSIARMVHNYECRMAAKAASSTRVVDTANSTEFVGPEAKRQSRRQAQQTYYARDRSAAIHTYADKPAIRPAVSAANVEDDADDIDVADDSKEPLRVERRSRATVAYSKRLSVQVEDGTASEEFIEGVFRSINALNRAISIAHQVRVRSAHTEYYLNAVQVILRLRENTVADNWGEVRSYLESEENWSDLPAAALEEIHACKEGMLYQKHMVQLTQAFYAGAIYGLPHEIDYDTISFDQLSEALEECQKIHFTDPSAVMLMEFAERLVSVRHLLLEDQWQDSDELVVLDEFAAERERTTKLRKSVYSHPLQKKNEHRPETVDECVRDFLEYQSVALPKLQHLLRVSGSSTESDWGEKVDLQEVLREARRVLSGRSAEVATTSSFFTALAAPGVHLAEQKADEWMEHMWHAVLHVVLELNLAQQATKYRTVLFNLSAAADHIPELVKVFRGDKHHVHAHVHPLLRNTLHHEDVTLYGAADATSASGYLNVKKNFNVKELQIALQRAKDYLSSVGFETSEEMLQLQQTSNILLEFRTVLNAQESHEDLLQLLRRTKQQEAKGFISNESGVHELNVYIAATGESVRIQAGLRKAMHAHYAYGPLNALHVLSISTDELQKWIDEAMAFLARGGSALSIGIPSLLLQARVLHKLRSALINHEWSVLEYTLRYYQAAHWDVAGEEFGHIQCAYRFRQVKREMRQFLRDYNSVEDVEHGLMSMDIDLRELNSIFTEIHNLLQYRSPLLLNNTSAHFAAVTDRSLAPSSESVFTRDFYVHLDFAAVFALWRLCQALHNNQWFVKQAIHDNEQQRVAEVIDPFLYAYFGLGDSNFVHNIVSVASSACVERCFAQGVERKNENVFEVLVATHWAVFPYTVKMYFNRVRNCLIDKYIRVNLKYYCKKGAIKMDEAGNLVISSVNLQFLKFAIQDAHRAEDLAMSLSVPFKWSAETQKWLDSANIVQRYRHALIVDQNTDAVLDLLRKDGLLRGHTQFDPKLFNVHIELEVVEKYAQAFIAERTALHCLQFLGSLKDQADVHFQEVALENEAVLEVFELAAAPISVAEPSAHLLDMLSIVSQLRDAIFSSMLGGSRRLTPILEGLRRSISYHPNSTLQLGDLERASNVLNAVCKKAYHAELLDYGAKPAQRRTPFIATAFASPGRPSRFGDSPMRTRNNYIGLTDTAPKAAPRTPVKARAVPQSDLEKTGVSLLQEYTQKIVTALCELMYFHEEENHLSIGCADRFTEKLRSMVPTSARSQAPYHCYLTLFRLKKELNDVYVVYEPRWVAALHIVLFYLQKEINQQESTEPESVAQMVNLSLDLIQFCKDIQLDRCVLTDYVQSHFKKAHSSTNGTKSPMGASAPDCAPSVLILVKHLSTINLQKEDAAVGAVVHELKLGLEEIVAVTASVAAKCAALSLENDIQSEDTVSSLALIRSLPIGSVSRAASQSKLLCKALAL